MPIKGGIDQAINLLSALSINERDKLLELIGAKDPTMAEVLRKGLITLEDIRFLSVKMLQEFLREISLDQLGLALRISSAELKSYVYTHISSSMKRQLDDILLGPPKPVAQVIEAQDAIIQKMRIMAEKGQLIIDRSGNDPYV